MPLFDYELCVERKSKKEYYYQLLKEGKIEFQYSHKDCPLQMNHTGALVRGILKRLSGKITIKKDEGIEASVNDENIQKKDNGFIIICRSST